MLRPLYLGPPEQEAAKEFAGARKKAFLRWIGVLIATFFGFFTILIIVGGSVLSTYWISKDE